MATINYVASASSIDPNVSFSLMADPTVYESLVWITAPIPKATLEQHYLLAEKQRIAASLNTQMQADGQSGFWSDALLSGTLRKYATSLQGQIVIIGAFVNIVHGEEEMDGSADKTFTLPSTDVNGLTRFDAHDEAQLYKLLADMGRFSNGLVMKLAGKVNTVMSANTGNVNNDLDTIRAVTW